MSEQSEKDFSFWRDRISAAGTVRDLRGVGGNISRFQGQVDIFTGAAQLDGNLLAELRKMFDGKMGKLTGKKPGAKEKNDGIREQASAFF